MELKGKTAIVPGSGRGIGEGITLVLAREGAKVVVNSRNAEECEGVLKRILSSGGNAIAVGEAVSFLAIDRAGAIIGQRLAVDGGLLTGFGEGLRAVVRQRMETMESGCKH